ncbi:hypothetical protein KL930_004018 [Ogataea haglerorum]|uniref:Uncharacterized protein n=1 Tax=Ogataea haglerorum TaxID=1937702 RepID=A0AAN6D9F8_9ASCO|nr:uncharacterized protein KL911_001362 [Ogataea haglerorum]KAG7693378.1 hypothetical protein KL915_004277 [Ogataea haglerorum]KAG7694217.1 hypothetical protein KL951_004095 [Ogataea haglerorum]KAG7711938.1 hypothetical protein KL914_000580 [Ogataea haglerorum]KAG7712709.1 hypothetical protein KL950_000580 [Ogataea haglerorum]KAG7722760.1 hypothetical protein KL913_000580 [Ogataea haglerorum]
MSSSETAKNSKITTNTYSHVFKYPLVAEVSALAEKSSTVRVVESYAHSLLSRVLSVLSSVSILVLLLNAIDQTTDATLSYLDRTFPFLTTISTETISKALNGYYDRWVRGAVKNTRATFANTASSVRSRLSAVVKRFNDYYESALDRLLPLKNQAEAKGQEVTDIAQSELTRSRKLLRSTYERALPYVHQVSGLPQYVTEVYNSEKSSSSAPAAIAKTSRRLSNEAYVNAIKPTYDATLKPTVDRIIGSQSLHTNGAVDTVAEPLNGSL